MSSKLFYVKSDNVQVSKTFSLKIFRKSTTDYFQANLTVDAGSSNYEFILGLSGLCRSVHAAFNNW